MKKFWSCSRVSIISDTPVEDIDPDEASSKEDIFVDWLTESKEQALS